MKATRTGLQRRHILAAVIGNGLEAYDFVIYSFFAIQIAQALFPSADPSASLLLSLATFGAGFLSRPIGALLIGAYSDRVGRRPAMILSLAIMGISTVLFAFIPSYQTIGLVAPIAALLCRLLQGFALGGEVGTNTAFLMEGAPETRRGLGVSWQAVSQMIAVIIGSFIGLVMSSLMSPEELTSYGWRIAFLVGALTLPIGLALRSGLPGQEHDLDRHDVTANANAHGSARQTSGRMQAARKEWKFLLLAVVIVGTGAIGSYISVYAVTFAQNSLHLPAQVGFLAQMISMVVAIPAVMLGGWLSDKYGRRPLNMFGTLAYLLSAYLIFSWIVSEKTQFALVVGLSLMSLVSNLNTASLYACLTESLPESIRATGYGLVYSVAIALLGGSTQLIVTYLIDLTGNPMAPAWYLMGAITISFIGATRLPESSPLHVKKRT